VVKAVRKEKYLHMRIHDDVKEQMRQCARQVGLSMSTWADQVLRNAIKEQQQETSGQSGGASGDA
jgi:antitoxin component of RelBE/YafQ-DinJ toxin-antitoxin module